jgi:cytochrome c biogenesis protein CcdA
VGTTLGAASLLAAQGQQLPQVAAIMFVFGLGAALPLLGIGLASREGSAALAHASPRRRSGREIGIRRAAHRPRRAGGDGHR